MASHRSVSMTSFDEGHSSEEHGYDFTTPRQSSPELSTLSDSLNDSQLKAIMGPLFSEDNLFEEGWTEDDEVPSFMIGSYDPKNQIVKDYQARFAHALDLGGAYLRQKPLSRH